MQFITNIHFCCSVVLTIGNSFAHAIQFIHLNHVKVNALLFSLESGIPQTAHQLSKVGSLSGVIAPAAGHERVKGGRAVLRLGQSHALLQLVDDILVFQPEERLLTPTHDLPHTHRWSQRDSNQGLN